MEAQTQLRAEQEGGISSWVQSRPLFHSPTPWGTFHPPITPVTSIHLIERSLLQYNSIHYPFPLHLEIHFKVNTWLQFRPASPSPPHCRGILHLEEVTRLSFHPHSPPPRTSVHLMEGLLVGYNPLHPLPPRLHFMERSLLGYNPIAHSFPLYFRSTPHWDVILSPLPSFLTLGYTSWGVQHMVMVPSPIPFPLYPRINLTGRSTLGEGAILTHARTHTTPCVHTNHSPHWQQRSCNTPHLPSGTVSGKWKNLSLQ